LPKLNNKSKNNEKKYIIRYFNIYCGNRNRVMLHMRS